MAARSNGSMSDPSGWRRLWNDSRFSKCSRFFSFAKKKEKKVNLNSEFPYNWRERKRGIRQQNTICVLKVMRQTEKQTCFSVQPTITVNWTKQATWGHQLHCLWHTEGPLCSDFLSMKIGMNTSLFPFMLLWSYHHMYSGDSYSNTSIECIFFSAIQEYLCSPLIPLVKLARYV